MAATVWLRNRADLLLSATGAALLASLLVWLGPPGTDLAAHVYQRTLFLEHGFVLWNNFWYSGRYSFVTYSVLYYPLAAVLGIKLLAVLIVAVSVASFAVLVRHEWGEQSKWAIRAFAVVWAGLVLSAAYPFMLGIALALLALCSLQRGRYALFIACTLLTIAASPLAFLLLVVVLAGVALARRGDGGRFLAPAVAIFAIGALEFLLRRMFPGRGSFPFSGQEFVAASAFCLIGLGLTWGIARARVLRWTFAVYLVACIAAFAVASPVGENIARLRFAAAPIAILTLSLRNWRPRPICAIALALAASWNLTPLAASFARGVEDPAGHASYWAPTIAYLQRHLPASYRVEAVDTAGHWPANFLARANIPLARGWFRQEDFPQNQVLYGELGPNAYIGWLRKVSVRYVVLTSAPPDYSSRAEAQLLRSGRSGLKVVHRTPTATVFEVPSPQPLVSAPARVLALGYSSIRLSVPTPGNYRLTVTYAPYWHTPSGCLRRTPDGMSELRVFRPGIVSLRFGVTAGRVLKTLVGEGSETCPAR
ncbi:MAG: hypothetical protein E6G03_06855 [Actinobacteria bacterium]|nr:MAG: hypothetical protein E6G03_06855 [Actinomycetota bacterium]